MRKNSLWIVAASLWLGTFLCPAASAEILLGQSIPLTGPLAKQGNAVVNGARAYFDRVNASGGVNGQRIKLITLDDRGDSKQTVSNSRELAAQGVIALFGSIEGGPCSELLPVVQELKLPLIACMAGAPQLREPIQRYVFPVRAAHLSEFAVLLDNAARLGRKRLAFVHSDSATGRLHLANVTRLAGERGIVIAAPIAFSGKPDVAAIARQIVDKQADMVLNHGGYAMYAQLIKAVRALGSTAQFLAVNSGGQEFADAAGADGQGTIMTQIVPLPTRRGLAIQRDYENHFHAAFPKESFGFSSMEGYVSARMMVETLKRVPAGRFSREALVTAAESLGRLDLGGFEVRYGPNDRTGSTFVDVTIISKNQAFVN